MKASGSEEGAFTIAVVSGLAGATFGELFFGSIGLLVGLIGIGTLAGIVAEKLNF